MDTDPIILPDGSKLNCFLYANDLILISNTAEGLQRSLDTLSKFCNDWLLNINLKKTKVIIFQKELRQSTFNNHFKINKEKIELSATTLILVPISHQMEIFEIINYILKEKTRSMSATRRLACEQAPWLGKTKRNSPAPTLPLLLPRPASFIFPSREACSQATRRYLNFSKLLTDVVNKLFDSLFHPILMYGSEVWGVYDKNDYNSWEKDIIERTHPFL